MDPSTRTTTVDYSGQAVFEAGVLLFELAFGKHPLPGYPSMHVSHLGTCYTVADACVLPEELASAIAQAGYPHAFIPLVRRCVSPVAADRPTLVELLVGLAAMFSDVQLASVLRVCDDPW